MRIGLETDAQGIGDGCASDYFNPDRFRKPVRIEKQRTKLKPDKNMKQTEKTTIDYEWLTRPTGDPFADAVYKHKFILQ